MNPTEEEITKIEQRFKLSEDEKEVIRNIEADDPFARAVVAHVRDCQGCKEAGRTGDYSLACEQGKGLAEGYFRANG